MSVPVKESDLGGKERRRKITRKLLSRRSGDLLVCVLAVATLGYASVKQLRARSGIAVSVFPADLDLGSIPEGDRRRGEMLISNLGAEPVPVRFEASCTCTVVADDEVILDAGATRAVSIHVDTEGKRGFYRGQVQVNHADDGTMLGVLLLSFVATSPALVTPRTLAITPSSQRAECVVYSLARVTPDELRVIPSLPELEVSVERIGVRSWSLVARLRGAVRSPRGELDVLERRGGSEVFLCTVPVSLSTAPGFTVRGAAWAREEDGERESWLLVEGELGSFTPRLRAPDHCSLTWSIVESDARGMAGGLWIRLRYPASAAGCEVALLTGMEGGEHVPVLLP